MNTRSRSKLAIRRLLTWRLSASERKQADKYKQTGGSGQYGHVKIRLEPNEPGKGSEFEDATKGGLIPKEYIKPIEMGIKEAMEGGLRVGYPMVAAYPMVNIKATLYDGSYHEVDSNELAFKFAASMAFGEAACKASPVLLEPVMSVEVVVPQEYMGTIIGDLNSRRGRIEGIEHRAGSQVIKSMVPLADIFGYAANLRSSTRGRGRSPCTSPATKRFHVEASLAAMKQVSPPTNPTVQSHEVVSPLPSRTPHESPVCRLVPHNSRSGG